MRVSVNVLGNNSNAIKTTRAMAQGAKRNGDTVDIRSDRDHHMRGYDAAVLWGFVTSCQTIVEQCRANRIPFVFLDLAYWSRGSHYKVAVNDRHPTAYFMQKDLPKDRFSVLNLEIKPWRKRRDGNILLAGMSGKAAWAWKMQNEAYERLAVVELRKVTERPIIYRPKPNWTEATKINGTKFDKTTPVQQALDEAYCVVSHHSNVACDALLNGVPVFTKYGAASVLGPHNLDKVETPEYPDGREQWAYNLAYCQWSLHEMEQGRCWDHLKTSGLLGKDRS